MLFYVLSILFTFNALIWIFPTSVNYFSYAESNLLFKLSFVLFSVTLFLNYWVKFYSFIWIRFLVIFSILPFFLLLTITIILTSMIPIYWVTCTSVSAFSLLICYSISIYAKFLIECLALVWKSMNGLDSVSSSKEFILSSYKWWKG